MSKESIIQAVRQLASDRDLDPQSRYDILNEVGAIVEAEANTLFDENDIEGIDEDEDDEFDYDEDDEDDDFDDDEDEFDYDFDDEDEYEDD
jgi:hypothetical protein